MTDVYVVAGSVSKGKAVTDAQLKAITPTAQQTISNIVHKTTGMTDQKPTGGAGVQVNVIVNELTQGGNGAQCKVIGDLFEIPSKERLSGAVSVRGEGTAVGTGTTAANKCIETAVTAMMGNAAKVIIAANAVAAAPPPAPNAPKQIFVGTVDVFYTKDANKAPQQFGPAAIEAVKARAERLIAGNKHFVRAGQTAGMPGFQLSFTISEVTINATAQSCSVKLDGHIDSVPAGTMHSAGLTGSGTVGGSVADKDMPTNIADVAEGTIRKVLAEIDK